MPRRPPELWRLLGQTGQPPAGLGGTVVASVKEQHFLRQEIHIETVAGTIPGTLLCPLERIHPGSAVLYCHAHGNRHDIGRRELLEGRPALEAPYGPALAASGHTVLSIDMPGHNDRAAEGSEDHLSKAGLWLGEPLFGRMLADLSAALDYLAARDDVDAGRIATLGLSMGATHAYWLAALDRRVAGVAHLCAFANIKPLIRSGAHDLHGHYMTVPGLLHHFDMADIASLVSPRPQLVAYGATDPLTPPSAIEPALETLREAYRRANASDNLTVIQSPKTGHVETPDMRSAVMRFLDQFA